MESLSFVLLQGFKALTSLLYILLHRCPFYIWHSIDYRGFCPFVLQHIIHIIHLVIWLYISIGDPVYLFYALTQHIQDWHFYFRTYFSCVYLFVVLNCVSTYQLSKSKYLFLSIWLNDTMEINISVKSKPPT